MRPSFYISIPHELAIKKGDAWIDTGEQEYFVFRTHWLIKERQLAERAKIGEKVGLIGSAPVRGRKWSGSQETEWEIVDGEESIRQVLIEEENKTGIASELAAEVSPLAIAKTQAKLKANLERRLREQDSLSVRAQRGLTFKRNTTFQWEFPIPDDSGDRWCASAVYQRFAYDVYLTYADFIFVRYDRPSLFSLSKVRYKFPEMKGAFHPNWIKIHQPLCSILFWKLLPNATVIQKESDYLQELEDPYELVGQPLTTCPSHSSRPSVPSLYELSNDAFPPRWGHSISPLGRVEEPKRRSRS